MIYGIGTDIVRIERMNSLWQRHGQRALDKLLAPGELADFALAADKGRFLAKRFAAKEAFAKAVGTGVRPPVLLPALGVTHDALGKPGFAFYGQLAEWIENQGFKAHLSISDEREFALAYVIVEHE